MNRLKRYREDYNYSCDKMAKMLGISKTFYWQIENNKRRLSYDMAVRISKIFNTTPDEIFYENSKTILKESPIKKLT